MPPNLIQLGKSLLPTRLEVRLALAAGACLLWVFWPTLADMAVRWGNESRYSHGFIVPVFALYLLWSRRNMFPDEVSRGASWWGLALLAFGLMLRFAGTYVFFDWLAAVALLPCVAGLVMLAVGRQSLWWSWPAIVFLVFMIPLPFRLETALAHPLQRVATVSSTFMLQTLGFIAFSEGNVIRLGDLPINVAEACSGLNMLLVFFALACGVALVARVTPLEKTAIVLSAVPIALLTNVLRILVTAILHKSIGGEIADRFFHDVGGWVMPIVALGLLWAELRLMAWVLVSAPSDTPEPMNFGWPPTGAAAPAATNTPSQDPAAA